MSGYFSCRFDNLANRVANAVSQIKNIAFAAIHKILNRENMRLS